MRPSGDFQPESLSVYTHLPLPSQSSIRLLRIQKPNDQDSIVECSLKVVDTRDKPSFRALSYCWGPWSEEARNDGVTDARIFPILCNGVKLLVTRNLKEFLTLVRILDLLEASDFLWIDAICINQNDDLERGHQVNQTGDIYGSAAQVIVWLGKEDFNTKDALDLFHSFAAVPEPMLQRIAVTTMIGDREAVKRFDPFVGRSKSSLDTLCRLLTRNWFDRLWVLQEIVLAQEIRILCGHHHLSWTDIFSVSSSITHAKQFQFQEIGDLPAENSPARFPGTDIPYLGKLIGSTILGLVHYRNSYRNGSVSPLLTALVTGRGFQVTDPKDRVFALLAISKHSVNTVHGRASVSYLQSLEDLYFTVAESILKDQGDLRLLSFVEDHSIRAVQGMPSWVPDWSCPRTSEFTGGLRKFNAAGCMVTRDVKIDQKERILSVRGIQLDLISETGESKVEFAMSRVFPRWLGIIASLESVYWTGELRSDVFGKTLVADALSAVFLESEFRTSFREWLIISTLTVMSLPRSGDLSPGIRTTIERLAELSQTDDNGTIPTPEGVLKFLDEIPQQVGVHTGRESESYQFHFQRHPLTRLFCTKKKYLGLGPQSLQPGDSVWILPGVQAPFTLRQIPGGRKNHFRLVGETYVHGFMDGEAVKGGRLKFKTIYIE